MLWTVLTYDRNRLEFEHLYGVVWGTKYGRFAAITISEHEHLTRKTIVSRGDQLSLLASCVSVVVSGVLCHHCYSC